MHITSQRHHRSGSTIQYRIGLLALTMLLGSSIGCSSMFPDSTSDVFSSKPSAASVAATQASLALRKGEIAEQQGKTPEAIRAYEQARSLSPEMQHLSRRLAVLYDKNGNDSQAVQCYQHAVTQQPQDADLLNDFGVFYLHREQWPQAEAAFRRTLTAAPSHQRATCNLAIALAMQNRLQESYDTFQGVVGPAAAHSNLGVLLTRLGRRNEAQQQFHRALAINSNTRPAQELLQRLQQPSLAEAPQQDTNLQPASHNQRYQ